MKNLVAFVSIAVLVSGCSVPEATKVSEKQSSTSAPTPTPVTPAPVPVTTIPITPAPVTPAPVVPAPVTPPPPAPPAGITRVFATVETSPVPSSGDAADDTAFWVHPTDVSKSTIIGTNKLGGIAVYDLAGKQLSYRADGNINNVDIRYNFQLAGTSTAIVVASNRSSNSLSIYRVNATTRALESISARTISLGIDAYGFCMYRSPMTGKYYGFVNEKGGSIQQWELQATAAGLVDAVKVRTLAVGSQAEGCVADDDTGALYVAEEAKGIWQYSAEPNGGTSRIAIDTTGSGGHLTSDVEGLSIYYAANGKGYLLASSQGNNSYVVYDRKSGAYITTFRVETEGQIDGTSDTDGIDVLSFGLGPAFPYGMFISQDGANSGGNQNYKLVPWEKVAHSIPAVLLKDTSQDPRLVGKK